MDSSYMTSPPTEIKNGLVEEFIRRTGNSALKTGICAVCGREQPMTDCSQCNLRAEHILAFRECLEHESGEVSIFSEQKQVLVQSINNAWLHMIAREWKGPSDVLLIKIDNRRKKVKSMNSAISIIQPMTTPRKIEGCIRIMFGGQSK